MRRSLRWQVLDAVLRPPAALLVLVEKVFWRGGRTLLRRIAGWPPLRRLHDRLGLLPPWVALPLFLVPEAASRAGFFVSAWLVWEGQARMAALVYGGSKVVAGGIAIWIYFACEPALLRVRWFRAAHDWVMALRERALARLYHALARRHTNGHEE